MTLNINVIKTKFYKFIVLSFCFFESFISRKTTNFDLIIFETKLGYMDKLLEFFKLFEAVKRKLLNMMKKSINKSLEIFILRISVTQT